MEVDLNNLNTLVYRNNHKPENTGILTTGGNTAADKIDTAVPREPSVKLSISEEGRALSKQLPIQLKTAEQTGKMTLEESHALAKRAFEADMRASKATAQLHEMRL